MRSGGGSLPAGWDGSVRVRDADPSGCRPVRDVRAPPKGSTVSFHGFDVVTGTRDVTVERHSRIIATGENDEEDVDLHKHDHEGTVSYESGASTDDLVAGLASIKADERET